MKATMDVHGVITLKPESSIEAFALRNWIDDAWISQEDLMRMESGHWRSSNLMVCTDFEEAES